MKISFLTLAAIIVGFLGGCSDDVIRPNTDASDDQTNGKGLRPLTIMGITTPPAIAGFQCYRLRTTWSDGTLTESDVVRCLLFHDDSSNAVFGGTVTMNSVALNATTFAEGTEYLNVANPPGNSQIVPLSFNGGTNTFAVTGNTTFPSVQLSIPSPAAGLNVTYPSYTDTISKSSGFTLLWNSAGADTVRVMVLDTNKATGHRNFVKALDDVGSLQISSTDLANLQPGPIEISVTCGNYAIEETGNGEVLVGAIYSVNRIQTVLVP